jgi:hypothetical protein
MAVAVHRLLGIDRLLRDRERRIDMAASTCFCTNSKPSSSTWRRPTSREAMIW